MANGLENESYAEAIQRLSDLEWLTHKQVNDTVVDGLFTGQLVEAYHSVEHGHISVNLQAFNILPVPIAPPRYSSGLVMLEDCFTSFCNVENLTDATTAPNNNINMAAPITHHIGQQPTQQLYPNAAPLVNISSVHLRSNQGLNFKASGGRFGSTPLTRRTTRAATQEQQYSHPLSPIVQQQMSFPSPITTCMANTNCSPTQLLSSSPSSPTVLPSFATHKEHLINDSGFHDNGFKTSTPIITSDGRIASASAGGAVMPKLQRRCLLRQLPECLIIQLMRFRYDQLTKTSTKINTSVSIRLKGLNLRDVIYDSVTQRNDLTASQGSYVYELYGVCLHLGANSTSHGHYVNYCYDGEKWYRMDDQTVEEVNMEFQLSTEEIRQNAYLLFYRRMGSDSM